MSIVSPHGRIGTTAQTTNLPSLLEAAQLFHELSSFSPDTLNEICERSYIHTNGFVKIVLRNYLDGSALRLHVWTERGAGTESDIHTHWWSFRSVVLCGELEHRIYSIDEEGPLHRYKYASANGGRDFSLERIGSVTANLQAHFTMPKGFTYLLHPSAYHTISAKVPMTASLILTGPPEAEENYVLSETKPELAISSPKLSVDSLSEIIHDLTRRVAL